MSTANVIELSAPESLSCPERTDLAEEASRLMRIAIDAVENRTSAARQAKVAASKLRRVHTANLNLKDEP